jgi:dihydrofolate reductase
MGKVIASNLMSLDGSFAGPNGELDWFVQDEGLDKSARGLLDTVGTILYGRATYELMAGYWPYATGSFADRTNKLPKIVFSNTLEKTPWGEWNNARPIKGNIAEEVAKLKQQAGKDMVIYGSGSVVSTLTQSGLIDEYQILINPVVLGGGKPLFKDIRGRVNLKLLEARTFDSGVVELRYQSTK